MKHLVKNQHEPDWKAVIQLAMDAAEKILPHWKQSLSITTKEDETPVTQADLAAHLCIVEGLTRLDSSIPILSEEAADIPFFERLTWKHWWLVDPLDGTKDFIAHHPDFTVNIAYINQGVAEWGVVVVPATGTGYAGGKHFATRSLTKKEPPKIIQTLMHNHPELVMDSQRHGSEAQSLFMSRLKTRFPSAQTCRVGSSLKFCRIAEGLADLYPRLIPTSQWDTAAAQAVLEGAGGQVLDLQGKPLSYEARADFLNPWFLACPNDVDWLEDCLQIANEVCVQTQ